MPLPRVETSSPSAPSQPPRQASSESDDKFRAFLGPQQFSGWRCVKGGPGSRPTSPSLSLWSAWRRRLGLGLSSAAPLLPWPHTRVWRTTPRELSVPQMLSTCRVPRPGPILPRLRVGGRQTHFQRVKTWCGQDRDGRGPWCGRGLRGRRSRRAREGRMAKPVALRARELGVREEISRCGQRFRSQ